MAYTPYYSGGWQSGEEGGTPITPDALNHMEEGIEDSLPLAGGTMTGTLDMGQASASGSARSVQWTTADDTVFQWRPYNNLMQLVRTPSGGTASNALGISSDGTVSMDNPANWRIALSLYSKAEVDAMFQPKLYSVRGNIVRSASSGTAVGYGKATVIVLGDTVQVDFEAQIVTAGTSSSISDIGIQIANLRSINSNIPAFTTLNGGNIHYYKSDGTLDTSHEGYAGESTMSTDNSRWIFARLYNTSGSIGAWIDNTYTTGLRITGTLWGALS